jgi:hypothetical protein
MKVDEPTPMPGAPPAPRPLEDLPTARTMKSSGPPPSAEESAIREANPGGMPGEAQEIASDPSRQINQYLLVSQVGAGGMGAVWKAWDTRAGRWVALKFLNATDDDSIRRFRREAQVTQRLRHPNICAIHEISEAKGRTYLVMDYIEGGAIGSTGAPLTATVETFVKVCRAIEFAHKNGVIHRDIKPANIMVSVSGEPVVTDFGLAKVVMPQSTISIAAAVMGTPSFMPPEQASGRIQAQDEQSDIYSLGATLYTVATGRPPFERENATATLFEVCSTDPLPPRRINPAIPRPLEAVILKAMDKDKRLRYANAGELADDLTRFLEGQAVVARTAGPVRKLARRLRANPLAAAGAAALLLAVSVMVALLLRGRAESVIIHAPPPPVPLGPIDQQKWREKFEPFQGQLLFYNFKGFPPERIAECRRLLASMPEAIAGEVALWFLGQAVLVPAEVWPKREWMEKKGEAQRRVDWCRAVLAVLEGRGGKFVEVREAAAPRIERYAPVLAYRGSFTLRIAANPYAEVQSLRAGDLWVVRDGRRIPGSAATLYTPAVLEDLDIADYALVLANPRFGAKTFAIPAKDLRHQGTYLYSGALDRAVPFTLREIR